MAAEGCLARAMASPAGMSRQWGRDRMAAEGGMRRQSCRSVMSASMGPRPDGRGRTCGTNTPSSTTGVNGAATGWPRKEGAPLIFPLGTLRQWGRDRMAAEGGLADGSYQVLAASMGPRPDGRGREIFCRVHGDHVSGVNGAATGWPRKEGARVQLITARLASMGPRPDGRGRRP